MPRLPAALAVLLTMGFCIGFNTIRYPVVWQMVSEANHWPPPASPRSDAAEGADSPAPAASGSQAASRPRACQAPRAEPRLAGPIPTVPGATEGDSPLCAGRKSGQSPPPKMRVVCNGSTCCLVKETAPEPAVPSAAAPPLGVSRVDCPPVLPAAPAGKQPVAPAVSHGAPTAELSRPPAAPIEALPSDSPEATVAAQLVPIVRPPKPAAVAAVLTSVCEVTEVDHDRLTQDKVRHLPPIDRVFPAEPASSPQEELPADQVPFYPSTSARPGLKF